MGDGSIGIWINFFWPKQIINKAHFHHPKLCISGSNDWDIITLFLVVQVDYNPVTNFLGQPTGPIPHVPLNSWEISERNGILQKELPGLQATEDQATFYKTCGECSL